MAEWRKLTKALILAEGHIDTKEVRILRQAFLDYDCIDQEELLFLKELRNQAKSYVKPFTELYIDSIKNYMLADGGYLNPEKAKWLHQAIFADGQVDEDEKHLLRELKTEARQISPEFEALYQAAVEK
jgi:hypothetical protein